MQTPWGKAQSVTQVSEGIQSVSTSGHGGYKLDRKRNAQVHAALRKAGGWYEEDCDWAIVVFTFKDRYTSEEYSGAVSTIKNRNPDGYSAATGEAIALEESSTLRRRKAENEARGKLQSFSAYGSWHQAVPEGMVGLVAKVDGRDGAGECRYFLVPAEEYEIRDLVFVVDPERHQEVASFSSNTKRVSVEEILQP